MMGGMADPRAGQPARPQDLVDLPHLVTAYYTGVPDPDSDRWAEQQVVFGTSGHRGSSLDTAFNETHILATTQAICDYRSRQGIDGPLFMGKDTHALSEPAWVSALEVFAAYGFRGARIDQIAEENTQKVLAAFQEHKVAEAHLQGSTGYGYDDLGRDELGKIYASIFQTEDAHGRL